MKFKETKYGDLTNKIRKTHINLENTKENNKTKLISLEGSPKKTQKNFNINYNNLTSLAYSPEKVDGNFYCSNNNLKSLKYSPKEIGGDFNCNNNELTTLEGSPIKIFNNFDCVNNKLESLKGSPIYVEGDFDCGSNELKSLEGNLKLITKTFDCMFNPELKNIKQQIIKYGIKADYYKTDEGNFTYQSIQKEFEETNKIFKLEDLENNKKLQEKIKIIKETDYGLSI